MAERRAAEGGAVRSRAVPERVLSEVARLLAASRCRDVVTCLECGQRFEALTHRRYCSHACYMRTWRRKQAADGTATAGRGPVELAGGECFANAELAAKNLLADVDHCGAFEQASPGRVGFARWAALLQDLQLLHGVLAR